MRLKGFFVILAMGMSTHKVYAIPKSEQQLRNHLTKVYKHRKIAPQKKKQLNKALRYYYFHPIDLNNQETDKLAHLEIISDTQIRALTQYQATYGQLASFYELQAVPSWDATTIRLIHPFVCVRNTWLTRIQKIPTKETFNFHLTPNQIFRKSPKYFGDPSKCLLKYESKKQDHYRFVIIGSKKPHEPYYWDGKQKNGYGLLSYWAGYALIQNIGPCTQCLMGDYEIGLGQGLIMGTTFGMDKSQEVISIMKARYQGIKPNASYQRKSSFQGIALACQQDHWHLLLYHSQRKLDITLHQKQQNPPHITTLNTRGIAYTTTKDIDKKDSVEETMMGGALIYKHPSNTFNIGVQGLYSHYSIPLLLGKGVNHDYFFEGKENTNASIFANKLWKNYHFFGEVATSKNKSVATLAGVMASLGKKTAGSCVTYYYPPHFHALYGNAFSRQGSYNRNKEGCYVSCQHKITPKLSLKGYFEIAKYIVQHIKLHHAPACEQEVMACAIYKPKRDHIYNLIFKQTDKPKNRKGSKLIQPLLEMERKSKLTLKISYPLQKGYNAYTQAQLVTLKNDQGNTSYGGAIKQFFHYKKATIDLKCWFTLYYTQNHGSAVYLYVHRLRQGMHYPPHYGAGISTGILLRCHLTKNLRLGLEISFNSTNNSLPTMSLQLTYTS